MIEWSNKNQLNSFNSLKGLAYYENYQKIVTWLNGDSTYLLPPIECSIDPIAECNLQCYFCVTQRYLKYSREDAGDMRRLPSEYVYRLIPFLSQWGVKGVCFSGGGEPTLHSEMAIFLRLIAENNMQSAIATNGSNIDDSLAEALMLCRWVGISVDSSFRDEYTQIKGADKFNVVASNIKKLVALRARTSSKVDIAYKCLILPDNISSIHAACKVAKALGVQDFHVRPVDFERSDIKGHRPLAIDTKILEEQVAKCYEEETKDFHVFAVVHKFDTNLHVKHDFTRCLATPLVIPILSNGKSYLCIDKKMVPNFVLGESYPDPSKILDWWGTDKHRDLIKSVNIDTCSRCTWSQYNRQIEEAVEQDKMCLAFP
jgi:sulfatase maturation enzyme AslB (radical SAM superfamily)